MLLYLLNIFKDVYSKGLRIGVLLLFTPGYLSASEVLDIGAMLGERLTIESAGPFSLPGYRAVKGDASSTLMVKDSRGALFRLIFPMSIHYEGSSPVSGLLVSIFAQRLLLSLQIPFVPQYPIFTEVEEVGGKSSMALQMHPEGLLSRALAVPVLNDEKPCDFRKLSVVDKVKFISYTRILWAMREDARELFLADGKLSLSTVFGRSGMAEVDAILGPLRMPADGLTVQQLGDRLVLFLKKIFGFDTREWPVAIDSSTQQELDAFFSNQIYALRSTLELWRGEVLRHHVPFPFDLIGDHQDQTSAHMKQMRHILDQLTLVESSLEYIFAKISPSFVQRSFNKAKSAKFTKPMSTVMLNPFSDLGEASQLLQVPRFDSESSRKQSKRLLFSVIVAPFGVAYQVYERWKSERPDINPIFELRELAGKKDGDVLLIGNVDLDQVLSEGKSTNTILPPKTYLHMHGLPAGIALAGHDRETTYIRDFVLSYGKMVNLVEIEVDIEDRWHPTDKEWTDLFLKSRELGLRTLYLSELQPPPKSFLDELKKLNPGLIVEFLDHHETKSRSWHPKSVLEQIWHLYNYLPSAREFSVAFRDRGGIFLAADLLGVDEKRRPRLVREMLNYEEALPENSTYRLDRSGLRSEIRAKLERYQTNQVSIDKSRQQPILINLGQQTARSSSLSRITSSLFIETQGQITNTSLIWSTNSHHIGLYGPLDFLETVKSEMKLQNWARHFVWGGGGKSTAYLYIYTHLSDSNLDVIEKISELHRRKYNLDESRQESLTLCQTGF